MASSRGGEGFGSGRFYVSVYTLILKGFIYAGSLGFGHYIQFNY